MSSSYPTLNLPQSLGDGLVMRQAEPGDAAALADFNQNLHAGAEDPPDGIKLAILDLASGRHPTTSVADFILVEDQTAGNKIVSTSCLIPQTWAYEGLSIPAGHPEFVGTDPAYRRRGLTRAIFAQLHTLSRAYGHLAQGILGIPWFYRQFGYEYALSFGGGRKLDIRAIPDLATGETEPYQIRPATMADLPTLKRLYARHCQDLLVTSLFDEARWRFILEGNSPGSLAELHTFCLLNSKAEVIGYYQTQAYLWGSDLPLFHFMVDQTIAIPDVLPTVLRTLKKHGQALAAKSQGKELQSLWLRLNLNHPLFVLLDERLGPVKQPYAVYIRVSDLPALLHHLRPVLEERLARSALVGYSQTINITFYRGGLQLVFENGQLVQAEPWQDPGDQRPSAGFPPGTFLQLLFGYRSLAELRYAFPDCWANEASKPLLNILFPKRHSWLVPFG